MKLDDKKVSKHCKPNLYQEATREDPKAKLITKEITRRREATIILFLLFSNIFNLICFNIYNNGFN